MPSKSARKLLQSMKRSKAGRTRKELDRLYEGYGFEITHGGNHDKVSHPDFPQLLTSLPRHNRVHTWAVSQAIKMIEKLEMLQAQSQKDTGDDDVTEDIEDEQ